LEENEGDMRSRLVASGFVVALVGALGAPVHARTFTEQFLARNQAAGGGTVTAPAIVLIQRSAARGTDFPATTTTPGFTYRYNPELGIYERSSGSLGPAFLERAETLGRGRFDAAVSYLYADFTELDGDDLETDTFRPFIIRDISGFAVPEQAAFPKFTLRSHAFYFSSSYGLTDRWDVNLLVPVFHTEFEVDETLITQDGPQAVRVNEERIGIGDIQLRTKYRMLEQGDFRMAGGLSLILPSGEEEDFQGLGDTRVVPTLVASFARARFDVHGSAGVEFNGAEIDRTRARYGVGASYGILERLTVLVDVIGTSAFVDEELLVTRLAPGADAGELSAVEGVEIDGRDVFAVVERNDIVDLSVGLKANPWRSLVLFASAIVPITQDGIRADVIPSAGFNYSF
jgi:hypothetical protein